MSQVIQLPESLTIHYASEQMVAMKKAIADASGELTIDASALETIDTSGIQLLLVVVESLAEKGLKLRWLNPSELFVSSVANLGLSTKFQFASV
ncbi:STAS domain-containing protein [Thiomicrospira microaerophila]|uniref:STAS domain-containing protein n=1 Tax=Thiomicrospira microaerophila TaxID=406020 RepID=UPI0005C91F06|nr:STAS domain-containing protein [Thiomicrospira microaerophila]